VTEEKKVSLLSRRNFAGSVLVVSTKNKGGYFHAALGGGRGTISVGCASFQVYQLKTCSKVLVRNKEEKGSGGGGKEFSDTGSLFPGKGD